jgi:hypothetical protein
MAVIIIGQEKTHPYTNPTPTKTDYSCLTTDTKPTDCENGSTITVLDFATKEVDSIWIFNDGEWYKF